MLRDPIFEAKEFIGCAVPRVGKQIALALPVHRNNGDVQSSASVIPHFASQVVACLRRFQHAELARCAKCGCNFIL